MPSGKGDPLLRLDDLSMFRVLSFVGGNTGEFLPPTPIIISAATESPQSSLSVVEAAKLYYGLASVSTSWKRFLDEHIVNLSQGLEVDLDSVPGKEPQVMTWLCRHRPSISTIQCKSKELAMFMGGSLPEGTCKNLLNAAVGITGLKGLQRRSWRDLAHKCPKMETLDLVIDLKLLRQLAYYLLDFPTLPSVKNMSIGFPSDEGGHHRRLAEKMIVSKLVERLPNLVSLRLSLNERRTDDGADIPQTLQIHSSSLQRLDVTCFGFVELSLNCCSLLHFSSFGCKKSSEEDNYVVWQKVVRSVQVPVTCIGVIVDQKGEVVFEGPFEDFLTDRCSEPRYV